MNYTGDVIRNMPFENPYTKLAFGVGVCWLVFLGVKHAKAADDTPAKRRERKGWTTGKINHDIDKKNKAFGRRVPGNPNVPFYSRHNYNRRRRSKNFW